MMKKENNKNRSIPLQGIITDWIFISTYDQRGEGERESVYVCASSHLWTKADIKSLQHTTLWCGSFNRYFINVARLTKPQFQNKLVNSIKQKQFWAYTYTNFTNIWATLSTELFSPIFFFTTCLRCKLWLEQHHLHMDLPLTPLLLHTNHYKPCQQLYKE